MRNKIGGRALRGYMAIIEQGILGGFRGSVGTVVGYWRLGRWCIRARSVVFTDARSEAQLAQRSRFKTMISLSSQLGSAIQRGLTKASNERGMTEGNLFLKLNNQCFGYDGKVDYAALRLSKGRLPNVAYAEPRIEGSRVEVAFGKQRQLAGAHNDDVVHVYAYVPSLGEGRLMASTERRAKRVAFLLPDEYEGRQVHLYGFVEGSRTARYGTYSVAQKRHDKRLRNVEREVSDSAYIGLLGAAVEPQGSAEPAEATAVAVAAAVSSATGCETTPCVEGGARAPDDD